MKTFFFQMEIGILSEKLLFLSSNVGGHDIYATSIKLKTSIDIFI